MDFEVFLVVGGVTVEWFVCFCVVRSSQEVSLQFFLNVFVEFEVLSFGFGMKTLG